MRITRVITSICAICMMSTIANAQKTFNNSIRLHSGTFFKSESTPIPNFLTSFMGAYYERKLPLNLSVSAGYSYWHFPGQWESGDKVTIMENVFDPNPPKGTLLERRGYQMVDLAGHYNFAFSKQRHVLKGGLGISYCWGEDRYVENRYYVPEHNGYLGTSYSKTVGYWGVVPQLSYDYNFLKNRVNVGVDVRLRKYKDWHQFDTGVHVGVNF